MSCDVDSSLSFKVSFIIIRTIIQCTCIIMKSAWRTVFAVFYLLLCVHVCNSRLDSRIPVRILTLVPWPNDLEHADYDAGLSLLAGGRLAQKDINDNDNILPGYKIELIARGHEACGLLETTNGTNNLIENAVFPKAMGNVAAIAGLFCSTSTRPVALLAGHPGMSLIQLSASNSPIFRANHDSLYPHTWRFVISAEVYGLMMTQLMERFQWKNVALVQDLETIFMSNIAASFAKLITSNPNYNLVYRGGLIRTIDTIYTQVLDAIQQSEARIIFVAANFPQVANLMCFASQYNMVYPDYQWVFIGYSLNFYLGEDFCDNQTLEQAMNGSIISYFKFDLEDSEIIVSNRTYAEYKDGYREELEQVKLEYSQYSELVSFDEDIFAGLLYDQIWAFALALQAALPELERRNYSIADYGYGQPDITRLLEEELAKLDFLGSTGRIMFGKYKEVSTSIEVFQVNGSMENRFGLCTFDGENLTNVTFIPERDIYVPDDEIPENVIMLPTYASISIIVVIVTITLFVVATHIVLIFFRSTPHIKASSPILSSLMLVGCYFLCFAALFNLITISVEPLSQVVFAVLCNLDVLASFNGINLILVTLFIKILRIYRIFSNKRLIQLSCIWKNWFLVVIIIAICICPNLLFVVWFSIDPLNQTTSHYFVYTNGTGLPHYNVITVCRSDYEVIFYALVAMYLLTFMIGVVYVASRTSRIKQKNFKDTKKVNFFIFLVFLSTFAYAMVSVLLLVSDERIDDNSESRGRNTVGASVSRILGYLTLSLLCIMLLFAPKFTPLLCPSASKHLLSLTHFTTNKIL